jgi:tRNA 2-thiouridine synthesizing protein E
MEPAERYRIAFEGKQIPLDENGHLVNAKDWSEGLARHLADIDGIVLDDHHWPVIRFIRLYFDRFDSVPMPKVLIKGLNKEAGAERYTMKLLYGLFPDHPMRKACRYAGVPQPAGCT